MQKEVVSQEKLKISSYNNFGKLRSYLSDVTTSEPSEYTCDDLILDQCPDNHAWLIETVEDSEPSDVRGQIINISSESLAEYFNKAQNVKIIKSELIDDIEPSERNYGDFQLNLVQTEPVQ